MPSKGEAKKYGDLKALYFNCTLKRSPERSNTEGLMALSRAIMDKQGVAVESLRPVARMLEDAGAVPAHGNQRSRWDAGCRYGFENPDYR